MTETPPTKYRCTVDGHDEDLTPQVTAKIAKRRKRIDHPTLVVERMIDRISSSAALTKAFRRRRNRVHDGPIHVDCSKGHWNTFEWPGDGAE